MPRKSSRGGSTDRVTQANQIDMAIYVCIFYANLCGHVYLVPVKVFWLDGKPREVFTIHPPPYTQCPPNKKQNPG